MLQLKYLNVALLTLSSLSMSSSFAVTLKAMTDEQLSNTTGQALMSLSYIAPTDQSNPMKNITGANNIGFYKLGLEAKLELNANIRNLQLGCGGTNGAGACDIDIKNLSLSGLPTSNDVSGSPLYVDGRSSTSAELTNPFMEFAIANPNSASTREIKGLRFSAEKINALLTAGVANNETVSTTDGIQRLSGFMQIAATSGSVNTATGTFGKSTNEIIKGNIKVLGLIDSTFSSLPADAQTSGITLPSMHVGFSTPDFQVNGIRQSSAIISGINVSLGSIPLDAGPNNQLAVSLNPSILGIDYARVKLKTGSAVKNLNLSVDFAQSLSMIHNIPLTGTGGYLSLQDMALIWPGATVASGDIGKTALSQMGLGTDIAQKGWWMSFADPVQLGELKAVNPVDISSVYGQVASLMNAELANASQTINLGLKEALDALTNSVIETPKALVVDLNKATNPLLGGTPAKILLQNLQLANQKVVSNCYGSLKFC
ncbi:hypothetical protein [Acinetobacter sp. ANC 3832]|uniref:hypothetical protein n=1 Tax=Acinetobacter sp. ANC 3832 TaxID=1977874 RepID=UPI000B6A5C3D|nr:hypothetical protein [Acinetobacter sp. ANC 3832]OTG93108.1 hypothetical protein B9T35_11290 [Acinetobacter sp. ANC 3832]